MWSGLEKEWEEMMQFGADFCIKFLKMLRFTANGVDELQLE
jgi:hypothetical protein